MKKFSQQKEEKGCRERLMFYFIPKIINTYNKTMGGVDKSDQMKKPMKSIGTNLNIICDFSTICWTQWQ